MRWYLKAFKKYAVFSGRASRKEYWMFVLFNFIFLVCLVSVAVWLEGVETVETEQSVLVTIYQLVVFIPGLALTCRRMHDTGHSGWWQLVPIVNLIYCATEGTYGDNRFGPNPLGKLPQEKVVQPANYF